MNRKIICTVIFLVLLASVSALGVSPSKKFIDFEKGKTLQGDIIIINNQQEDFIAHIGVEGMLSGHIDFALNDINVTAADERIIIPYTLTLPDRDLPGGEIESEIIIIQEKKGASAISAQFAVISQWVLVVPLQGTSIDSRMLIGEAEPQEQVEFSIPVKNTGTEHLQDVHATIKIELNGKTVGETHTIFTDIAPAQQVKLDAKWIANVKKARYTAVATLYYNKRTTTMERDFNVGTPQLILTTLLLESFELGEVAQARAYVYNDWFEPASNARIEGDIMKDGQAVLPLSSQQQDIEPFEEKRFEMFFPTDKLREGEYVLSLDLVNDLARSTQLRKMEITQGGAVVEDTPMITGNASSTARLFNKEALLMGIIAILAILNIYWMVKRRG